MADVINLAERRRQKQVREYTKSDMIAPQSLSDMLRRFEDRRFETRLEPLKWRGIPLVSEEELNSSKPSTKGTIFWDGKDER